MKTSNFCTIHQQSKSTFSMNHHKTNKLFLFNDRPIFLGIGGGCYNNSGKLDLIMISLQVQMLLSYDVHKCNFS